MNTPAHIVVNAVILGRGRWHSQWFSITAGALLPDLPMFGFFLYQRLVVGTADATIWSQTYFEPDWQALFNSFHSLPLIALGAFIAWRCHSAPWLAFFASMSLHGLADLPLHNDDGHAHFFPVSNWRFHSPVSYWDPTHHGAPAMMLEALAALVCALALMRKQRATPWRVIGALALATYAAFAMFALLFWGGG